MGGVALEVALQAALLQRTGQLVTGLGEVVHADEHVTGVAQLLYRVLQDVELGGAGRQIGLVDAALRLEHGRQVRVVVQRDAVRRHRDHLVDGAFQRVRALQRQAVDQVHAHRLEAGLARGVDHQPGFRLALDAVHRLLYRRIEILDADAHAVETETAQVQHGVAANLARVDLDGKLAFRQQFEVAVDDAHHPVQLRIGEEGRCAAAEMQLDHLLATAEFFRHQRDFLFQVVEVGVGAALVLGDDLVAAAVVADGVAERDMHVQRDAAMVCPNGALRQAMFIIIHPETGVKTVGGRIGGVTRTGPFQCFDQGPVENTLGRDKCRMSSHHIF
ncbi:hypothetical protein D3C72_1284410 [compost metagenome]